MEKLINAGLIGYGIGGQVFHAPTLTSVKGMRLKKIRATNPAHVALARPAVSRHRSGGRCE